MNVDKEKAFASLLEGTISALQAILDELNAINDNKLGDSPTADIGETGTAETPATEEDVPPWEDTPVMFEVGRVLRLDKQKMTEGARLIKKFSMPPKREHTEDNVYECVSLFDSDNADNTTFDADWELFKDYNRRDVETEMTIQARLSKFPVPDFIWREYSSLIIY